MKYFSVIYSLDLCCAFFHQHAMHQKGLLHKGALRALFETMIKWD